MTDACDKHYTLVAFKPNTPGAHASCVPEWEYAEEFVRRELEAGSVVRRVTCNQAHRLLTVYLDHCDKLDAKKKRRPLPRKANL